MGGAKTDLEVSVGCVESNRLCKCQCAAVEMMERKTVPFWCIIGRVTIKCESVTEAIAVTPTNTTGNPALLYDHHPSPPAHS